MTVAATAIHSRMKFSRRRARTRRTVSVVPRADGSGDARAREFRSRGDAYRGGEDTEASLGDDHGARLEGGGRASAELHLSDRTWGERVSLDGDWTMISRRAGGRGARRAPRASVGSGPMAARWTRIESMEPSRVGSGSGARARARDAALARARRPQPADAVRLRFRAPEKRRGRPGAGRRGRRDGASLTLGALTTLAAAEMFMMAAILTCGCVR
jgi:hypothetical protein